MQNKLVIAALFATVKAAEVCDDKVTADLAANKVILDKMLVDTSALTAGLATSEAAELKLNNAAKTTKEDIETLMASFKTEYNAAKAKYDAEVITYGVHSASQTDLAAKVVVTTKALADAKALVVTKEAAIVTATANCAKIDSSHTEHTTEVTYLTGLTATAKTNWENAGTAEAAAKTAYETNNTNIGEAYNGTTDTTTAGLKKVQAEALTAHTAATAAKNTDITTGGTGELALWTAWRATTNAAARDSRLVTNMGTVCTEAANTCTISAPAAINSVDSQVKQMQTAATTAYGPATVGSTGKLADTAKAAWVVKADSVATLTVTEGDKKQQYDLDKAAYDAAAGNVAGLKSAWDTAKDTTTPAKLQLYNDAKAAQVVAEKQVAFLLTDKTNAAKVLADLKLELTPLQDDVVVKKYLDDIEIAKEKVAAAAKASSDSLKDDYKQLMDDGKLIYDQSMLKVTFYTTEFTKAAANYNAAKALHTANKNKVVQINADLEANKLAMAAAVAECKAVGYAVAQAAEKARSAKEAQRLKDVAAAKKAYDAAKPAAVTGGAAGTPCGYPTPNADARGTRPECGAELCCGAADKILLDGTKLTVETCQAKDATTFTFWPELPEGATVAPKAQTWRFYCISGAAKLAAAATTAAASLYMMA